MQSARESIKPFLVIGKPDDQGRQRGEIEATENLAPRRKDAKEMKNEEDHSSTFSPLCAFASLRESFPVSFTFSAFSFPTLAFLHLRRYHQNKTQFSPQNKHNISATLKSQ